MKPCPARLPAFREALQPLCHASQASAPWLSFRLSCSLPLSGTSTYEDHNSPLTYSSHKNSARMLKKEAITVSCLWRQKIAPSFQNSPLALPAYSKLGRPRVFLACLALPALRCQAAERPSPLRRDPAYVLVALYCRVAPVNEYDFIELVHSGLAGIIRIQNFHVGVFPHCPSLKNRLQAVLGRERRPHLGGLPAFSCPRPYPAAFAYFCLDYDEALLGLVSQRPCTVQPRRTFNALKALLFHGSDRSFVYLFWLLPEFPDRRIKAHNITIK